MRPRWPPHCARASGMWSCVMSSPPGACPSPVAVVNSCAPVRALAPGGLFLVNTSSVPRSRAGAELVRLRETFAGVLVVGDAAVVRGKRRGNLVAVARREPFTAAQADAVERAVRRLPLPVRTWEPQNPALPRP